MRRDFNRQRNVVGLHLPRQIFLVTQRPLHGKESWIRERLQVFAAFRALVLIEDSIANVLDVQGDPESEHQHQQGRTDERKGQPHRIA